MCWLVLLVVHQPAIGQQVVENRTISMSEQFSSGASVMIGPNVTIQSPAAVSFNARLVGFRGPVVVIGAEVVVTPEPVSSVTSNEGPGIAYTFSLDQNYPNPFSGETEIGFSPWPPTRGDSHLQCVGQTDQDADVWSEGEWLAFGPMGRARRFRPGGSQWGVLLHPQYRRSNDDPANDPDPITTFINQLANKLTAQPIVSG